MRCDCFGHYLIITIFVQKALDCGSKVHMVGLDFSAAIDHVNHKALIFKLSSLNFYQIDCQLDNYRNVISGVPHGSVLGLLLFILYTHDMQFGLENMLVSYADDATLLACIPSPNFIHN